MAINDKNRVDYAGDFRIDVCNIISYRKSDEDNSKAFRYNIKPQLLSFTLAEDITNPSIMGELMIADAQDIRTVLPLTGMERLELKFYNKGDTDLVISTLEEEGDPFYIYKMEKIRASGGTGRQQVYKLHFTSREVYRNMTRRVSKAFAGPIENAVFELVKSEKYLDSRKRLIVEETSTNTKLVIPNMRPFAAINLLSKHAISKNYKNAGFLFFETTEGYHFRSVESLMAIGGHTARPVKEQYAIQPAGARVEGDKDILQDQRSVQSYAFENAVNTLEQIDNGLYASKLVTHDIYNKKIETFNFDYHDSFGEYYHTEHFDGDKAANKFLYPDVPFDITEKRLSEHHESKLMSVVDTQKVHNDYEFVKPQDTLQNNISQREQLANFHLLLNVPGQCRMNAGDMIAFSLPKQVPVNPGEKLELNPYYSGRYLVLQIYHEFDILNQKHNMTMRCVKDAVKNELPQETETLIALKEKTANNEITVDMRDNEIVT